MKKISGYISFLGALGWLITFLYSAITEFENIDSKDIIIFFLLLIPIVSTIIYVKITNFGKISYTEIEKITKENELLKIQIEQKELKKQLES